MNKIELEKMRDDKFDIFGIPYDWKSNKIQFIFETIIPEVIKNILPKEHDWILIDFYEENQYAIENKLLYKIEQKAKELYWIDLF